MEEPKERRLFKNKQCENAVFPQESNLQPLDYRSTAQPLQREMSPRMLNFGYLNPATCLFYDFNNKSIVTFFSIVYVPSGLEGTSAEA